jgi:hypothetical protein
MQKLDYEGLGFRSGLEVHYQLLTDRKLFCRCPAGQYSTDYDAEILRHMRPTLSELGEYDGTALMEFKTHKEVVYQIRNEAVCTYEMDDTPCAPQKLHPKSGCEGNKPIIVVKSIQHRTGDYFLILPQPMTAHIHGSGCETFWIRNPWAQR